MKPILLCALVILRVYLCQETTTETEVDVCDNSTCSTPETTEALNTTLNTTETTNGTTETTTIAPDNNVEERNETIPYFDQGEDEVCLCNLERNACDINCCCDPDCTPTDKQVFSSCYTGLSNAYDSKYCHSFDYIYVNNTPTTIDVINDRIFCVVSSNLPPSYLIQASEPVETIAESEKLILKNYKWGEYQTESKQNFNLSRNLKHGDSIWIKNEQTGTIEPFYLPNSFITNVCLKKSEVKFLENVKSSCSHMINEEINRYLIPETYYDFSVINISTSINMTYNMDLTKECPKNICIPLNISLCDENFSSCDSISRNDSRLQHGCKFSLFNNEQTCTNIVRSLKYEFYHNGTGGFTSANLYLNLTNITFYISNDNEQFQQSFEIDFIWATHRTNYSNQLSGNPGYLIGKPILIAIVNTSTINETDATKFDFIQNDTSLINNFLVLPQGEVEQREGGTKIVPFGYNIRSTFNEVVVINRTVTKETCINIQEQIFKRWHVSIQNNVSHRYVGVFGNSDRSTRNDWVDIKYNFNVNDTFDNVSFFYKNSSSEIICYNLVHRYRANILYANIDLDNVKNQKKILSVYVDLGERKESRFNLDGVNTFKLINEVMFFDVTAKKIRKFVDPLSLSIKMPADFFYPFMRSSSKSNAVEINNLILSMIVIFVCRL